MNYLEFRGSLSHFNLYGLIVVVLELTGKLVGKKDESVLPMSLVDGPTIALLLTALVQLPA